MSLFQPAQTFYDPQDSQSGFAEPGAGAQTTGDPSFVSMPQPLIEMAPERPTKGIWSWLFPANPRGGQSGMPEAESALQHRPPGSMPNVPPIFGGVAYVESPEFSRGADAFVPNTGYLFTNPIGAGIVAMQRPQASYGPAGEFIDGGIWWTSQMTPTSVGIDGLVTAEQLATLLDDTDIQAVVRTY